MRHTAFIAVLAALLAASACNSNPPIIEIAPDNSAALDEHLIEANKVVAQSEDTQIEGYIQRRGWNMKTLSGGVRLEILRQGSGPMIGYGDTVTLLYSVEALNGTTFYEQAEKTVIVGKNQTVPGMETALGRLRRGAEARTIIPSLRAYGVVGDGDRIPTRAVLVCRFQVK